MGVFFSHNFSNCTATINIPRHDTEKEFKLVTILTFADKHFNVWVFSWPLKGIILNQHWRMSLESLAERLQRAMGIFISTQLSIKLLGEQHNTESQNLYCIISTTANKQPLGFICICLSRRRADDVYWIKREKSSIYGRLYTLKKKIIRTGVIWAWWPLQAM